MIPPIIFRYEGAGDFKAATPYMARLADRHYCVGETYRLVEHHERSTRSHNHYFAALSDAWATLHESLAADYPSAEHLRKKALIRCGYADERSIVCSSKAEALRVAAFIKPMDDYAIVVAKESVVTVYTAKSQSVRAMGAKTFQESKQAVLDFADRFLRDGPQAELSERAA